jgi:hypothetical protein
MQTDFPPLTNNECFDNWLAYFVSLFKKTIHLGDDTSGNYCEIKEDGEIFLHGTAKVIKEISFPLAETGSGATAPTLVRFGNLFGYAFDILDDGYLHFEVPSDYDDTQGITIFLRTAVNETYATQSAEVRWQGTYSCVPDDETEAITAATHTGTLDSGDVNIPGIARALQQVTLGTIPASDLALNDVIFILISRIALNDGVDPTAVPMIVQCGYEYVSDKLGEQTT